MGGGRFLFYEKYGDMPYGTPYLPLEERDAAEGATQQGRATRSSPLALPLGELAARSAD